MKKIAPDRLIMLVFGLIGCAFVLLGVVILGIGAEYLPQLTNPAVWAMEEAPDELALAICGVVFCGMGLLFVLVALLSLLAARRRESQRAELLTWGVRVTGRVEEIAPDHTIEWNGRHPVRVYVQVEHPTTHESRSLRSRQVWSTPLNPGDAVDVLFDPMNEKRHVIDLPEQA